MSNIRIKIPYQVESVFGMPIGDNGKDELIYYCPKCTERHGSPDRKGKLYVNTKSLKFNCFRCGFKGRISKNETYNEAKIYEEDLDESLNEIAHKIANLENQNRFPLTIPINKIFENDKAVSYLINRGFTEEQMEYYDMRVGNLTREFGRIIIPNEVNKLVYTDYYTARSFIGQMPKYKNPQAKKSEIVFNLHRIQEGSPIIVVEGPLTAVAAGHCAVATLGKTMTKSQASQIASKNPSIVYVNYDYGAEQWSKEACALLKTMLPYTKIMQVLMKDDRDAADLTKEEYLQCLNNAIEYNPLYDKLNKII